MYTNIFLDSVAKQDHSRERLRKIKLAAFFINNQAYLTTKSNVFVKKLFL
jgi:hypothetical protein